MKSYTHTKYHRNRYTFWQLNSNANDIWKNLFLSVYLSLSLYLIFGCRDVSPFAKAKASQSLKLYHSCFGFDFILFFFVCVFCFALAPAQWVCFDIRSVFIMCVRLFFFIIFLIIAFCSMKLFGFEMGDIRWYASSFLLYSFFFNIILYI